MGLCISSHELLEEASLMMVRYQIYEYSRILLRIFPPPLLFYPRFLGYPVPDSCSPKQFQTWAPFLGMDLKLDQLLLVIPTNSDPSLFQHILQAGQITIYMAGLVSQSQCTTDTGLEIETLGNKGVGL